MRAVVQRVMKASVSVAGRETGRIGQGVVVFLGVHADDTDRDCSYIADKVLNLRIFQDQEDKMNLSLKDIKGDILVISQFTLYGDTRKGRRPSFNDAAPPEKGMELYEYFTLLVEKSGLRIATGKFGERMAVEYINDGPVTILIDSAKVF